VDALVERQTKITMNAVAVWGDLAARRADEELAQWYRQHVGTTPTPLSAVQTMPLRPVPPPATAFGPTGSTPAHP
jgi:hypothetical protein